MKNVSDIYSGHFVLYLGYHARLDEKLYVYLTRRQVSF